MECSYLRLGQKCPKSATYMTKLYIIGEDIHFINLEKWLRRVVYVRKSASLLIHNDHFTGYKKM